VLAFFLGLLMVAFDPAAVRVLWAPFPGMQTEFVNAAEFEVFGGGAKGPGKSDCLVAQAVRQVHRPRYNGYLIRETGPQLDELKQRTHRLYPLMPEKPAWNGDGHGRWTFPSGARVMFESIATPEDVAKIQGKEPTFIGHDEAGNVKDEKTIDLEQAELRSPDPELVVMWRGTGNPGKAGHAWVKRRFITPCGEDGRRIVLRKVKLPNGLVGVLSRRFIPGTVLDNPIYANDPLYMAQLFTLPELLRRQLLYGDWNAGVGTALDELNAAVHMVRPFRVPEGWPRFGSFDWGYAHWWVLCHFAAAEDGQLYVVDTVRGRRHKPYQIAERIKSRVPELQQLQYIDTDTYAMQERRDRNDNTPSIQEELMTEHQIFLRLGNLDRKKGLNNLRHYLAWRGIGPEGRDALPALRFFDTPGNRWLFEQCEAMVTDESDPEDVLKVNADPETGVGGDDGYDALRVGVASRPPRAIGSYYAGDVRAFSKQTLNFMVETLYRDRPGLTSHMGQGSNLSTFLTGV
jgi:hypothetical protein